MYLRIEELGICRKCEDGIGGGFASVGVREGGIVLMGKDGSVNVWALSFVHDSAQSRRLNVENFWRVVLWGSTYLLRPFWQFETEDEIGGFCSIEVHRSIAQMWLPIHNTAQRSYRILMSKLIASADHAVCRAL
jgi:hypothetical protein